MDEDDGEKMGEGYEYGENVDVFEPEQQWRHELAPSSVFLTGTSGQSTQAEVTREDLKRREKDNKVKAAQREARAQWAAWASTTGSQGASAMTTARRRR